MLETLNPQPQDKILQLIAMFRDDKIIGPVLKRITSMTLEDGFLLVRAN